MGMFHRHSRGGKRLQRKAKSEHHAGARLAALLLCSSMLTGFLPALARAADAGESLSSIAIFDSITLHYAGDDGQSAGAEVQDNDLLGKDDRLVLCYTYTITGEQCGKIVADTPYYLDVSPHLVLPPSLKESLTTRDTKEQFGTLHADGDHAWVTFLPNADDSGTILSDYVDDDGDFEGADFYLTCRRADTVPDSEAPLEGHSNLYAMKFENTDKTLHFGYAENEPIRAEAKIEKGGILTDKTITWTINYTPWQNPSEDDGITLETPFELRDTIDNSLHSFVNGSVTIGDDPVTDTYTSRGDIPEKAETYVLVCSATKFLRNSDSENEKK